MKTGQTILVLGGGVGGVVAAVELRKRVSDVHRVILVDRDERHVFWPSLLWLMMGTREAESITRPLTALRRRGIEVIRGNVEEIDPDGKRVVIGGETITADYIIIALGADPAPERIAGLAESGSTFCTLDGAEALRDRWREFRGGKVVVLTAAPAYKCPAAPYEAAMLLEADARKRRIIERTTVEIHAAEPGPMGVAGPEASAQVRSMVESKGIGYFPGRQVTSADPSGRSLVFGDGATTDFDLLVYVPPFQAPDVVKRAGLLGDSGWATVDRATMETRFPDVYVIGDLVGIPLKMGKLLPKAGVFAHGQAEVVAKNVSARIAGRNADSRFDGHGECFIEAGGGKAGFGRGNFYADPVPQIKMYSPGRHWHAGKVLFEKDWLHKWF
ncbi:MAG: NAD(P)/FAD-dependent oxidoreductase [Deltaproteobacteria bacterium]|nr:NAD(P)/FAD-dependent oxidoreductase [Deltaproteobacteria bacterium]